MRGMKNCSQMENALIEYLDGRAKPADRHAIEAHLAACAGCRARAQEFRMLWEAIDEVPEISTSPAFEANLRARIVAEPVKSGFWDWLPSPRLAFAVTALVAMSAWLSTMPRVENSSPAQPPAAEAEISMIRDLPVLENYDVLSKFDALSELPDAPAKVEKESAIQDR